MTPVYVWDPNPFNPYGTELARVISTLGCTTVLIGRQPELASSLSVEYRDWLPPVSTISGPIRSRVRYLLACWRLIIASVRERPVIVVPWTLSFFDVLVLTFIARLRLTPVITVYHNPVAGRDEGFVAGLSRRLHRTASRCVVHSRGLAVGLVGQGNVVVAPHPAYIAWRRRFLDIHPPALTERAVQRQDRMSAIYLGGIRVDKGYDDLPAIAASCQRSGVALVLALGRVTAHQRAQLEKLPESVELVLSEGHVSDQDLARLLSRSHVLLAPYYNVTTSGTAILAVTCGVEVVAYRASAFDGVVSPALQVEPGDTQRLVQAAASVGETSPEVARRAEDLDGASRRAWQSLLDGLNQGIRHA